jgi:hypothetical protein
VHGKGIDRLGGKLDRDGRLPPAKEGGQFRAGLGPPHEQHGSDHGTQAGQQRG